MSKVIAALGVAGALSQSEIYQITVDDIEEKREGAVVVTIRETTAHKAKTFAVTKDLYEIYKKYRQLRPVYTPTTKLFINYHQGRCTIIPVGINQIEKVHKHIATFLRLPNAYLYTGHYFRRSAATLLVTSGAEWTDIKRLGGWKRDAAARGYLQALQPSSPIVLNIVLTFQKHYLNKKD